MGLAGHPPPLCSDRLIIYSRMRTRTKNSDDRGRCHCTCPKVTVSRLITCDNGGGRDRGKTPVTQSTEIRILKLKYFSNYTTFQVVLLAINTSY